MLNEKTKNKACTSKATKFMAKLWWLGTVTDVLMDKQIKKRVLSAAPYGLVSELNEHESKHDIQEKNKCREVKQGY